MPTRAPRSPYDTTRPRGTCSTARSTRSTTTSSTRGSLPPCARERATGTSPAPDPRRREDPVMRRTAALLVLLVFGVVSLPLVASVLDSQGTENWILPVQLLLMALLGALAGRLVPSLAGAGASPRRGVLVGAAIGLGCAVLGVVIFFLLLNGISGA